MEKKQPKTKSFNEYLKKRFSDKEIAELEAEAKGEAKRLRNKQLISAFDACALAATKSQVADK